MLAGFLDDPNHAMHEMLQPVQDLLRNDYVAVGILEEFNTTLSLFNATFNIPGVDWLKQYYHHGKANMNMELKAAEQDALRGAWTNSEIKRYMRLDLLLYEHAARVFHQQTRTRTVFVALVVEG